MRSRGLVLLLGGSIAMAGACLAQPVAVSGTAVGERAATMVPAPDSPDSVVTTLLQALGNAEQPATIVRDQDAPRIRAAIAGLLGSTEAERQILARRAIVTLRPLWPALDRLLDGTLNEILAPLANSAAPEQRLLAVESIATIGFPTALPYLRAALSDADPGVRGAAAAALRREAGARALQRQGVLAQPADLAAASDALLAAAGDSDLDVQRTATFALAELGDRRATPLLLRALDRERSGRGSEEARRHRIDQIVAALERLGDPAAFAPLAAIVRGEERIGEIRIADMLAGSLPQLDRDAARAFGLVLLEQPTWSTMRRAVLIFVALKDPALGERIFAEARLLGEFQYLELDWANYRGSHDAAPLLAVFRSLARSGTAVERRNLLALARVLGRIADPPTIEALIALLAEPQPPLREAVAVALGVARDRRAVPVLLALLRDRDVSVRSAAAGALGRLGDAGAVEPLAAQLTGEELRHELGVVGTKLPTEARAPARLPLAARRVLSPWNGYAAELIAALAALGDARALPGLRLHLATAPELRAPAIAALCRIGADDCTDLLLHILAEPQGGRAAASAVALLGRHGDARAVPALQAIVDGADRSLRPLALRALDERLGTAEGAGACRAGLQAGDPALRDMAAGRLVRRRDAIDQRLLARDLVVPERDGDDVQRRFWLGAGDVVGAARVQQAAQRLGLPVEDVRGRYEALAAEFGFSLTDTR